MGAVGRVVGICFVITLTLVCSFSNYLSWDDQNDYLVILMVFFGIVGYWFGKQYDIAKFHSEHDSLTHVYNRKFAYQKYPRLLKKAARKNKPLSILIVDADNLKIVNDICGHHTGDVLIQHVAEVLIKNFQKKDIVSRIGGDEFLIISPETDKLSALSLVDRIHHELQMISEFLPVSVSASIGVATYPSDSNSFDELMRIADSSMYSNKRQKPQKVIRKTFIVKKDDLTTTDIGVSSKEF